MPTMRERRTGISKSSACNIRHRFYRVPASNTAAGYSILENN
jgi:hypothetical protein